MLYTVHSSFKGRFLKTGREGNWGYTEKIEADDKETAKRIARQNILEKFEFEPESVSFASQNARASSRKN